MSARDDLIERAARLMNDVAPWDAVDPRFLHQVRMLVDAGIIPVPDAGGTVNDHMSVNVHGATDLDAALRDVLARLDLTDVTRGEKRSYPADKVTGPFETLDADGQIGDLHVTVTVFTQAPS